MADATVATTKDLTSRGMEALPKSAELGAMKDAALGMAAAAVATTKDVTVGTSPHHGHSGLFVAAGNAQGVTRVCKRKCVGHSACACCWTHGVDMEAGASVTRHSMTLRVLAEDDEDSSDDDDNDEGEAGLEGEGMADAKAEPGAEEATV